MCKAPNNTWNAVRGLELIAFVILLKHICILHGSQKFFKYYPYILLKNEQAKMK